MKEHITCDKSHGSIERNEEGQMMSVKLCLKNPETEKLRNIISSAISLITCNNHTQ